MRKSSVVLIVLWLSGCTFIPLEPTPPIESTAAKVKTMPVLVRDSRP